MPEADNVDPLLVVPDAVDDAIRPANNLAQIRIPKLRYHTARVIKS
jgi:hypothetical protein